MGDLDDFARRASEDDRMAGEVSIRSASREDCPGSSITAADLFVSLLGYQPIGHAWRVLDRDQLKIELTQRFQTSLAYRAMMLPPNTAAWMAESFTELFDRYSATFVTNFWSSPDGSFGWDPISSSTFEAAFVGIDQDKLILVLFEDED